MQLLVSVASATEAVAALSGGADLIDAKDPLAGALGAVSVEVLREIHTAVASSRPVTAALGDATNEMRVERDARAFAGAGVDLVKIGFGGIACAERVAALTAAAVRGAAAGHHGKAGIAVVAYADSDRAMSLPPDAFVTLAARAGADGVLLDTADKAGPGLRGLVTPRALAAWTARVHRTGLFVALAGKLTIADFQFVRDAGADIAGVRGAACDGGRIGCVTSAKVRLLAKLCDHRPSDTALRAPSGWVRPRSAPPPSAERSAFTRSAVTITDAT